MRIGLTGSLAPLLLLGVASWLVDAPPEPAAADNSRPPRQSPQPADDAASCGRCHTTILKEWRTTAHARAWTDEIYQAALREREEPELCHSCHIPDGVHGRLGRPPRARAEHRHDGVGCAACHVTRSGIAGPFGTETDAHPTVEHPAFDERGSTALCASCHDLEIGPVLPLARDFRAAGLAERRKSCIGCHMPRVERPIANHPDSDAAAGPARQGRSHRLRGPSDPEFAASAFKLRVQASTRRDDQLELSLGNRAGHRVPGLHGRAFVFTITQSDRSGDAIGTPQTVRIDADNPIRAAETRRFYLSRQPRAVRVEVVGEHRLDGHETVRILASDIDL